MPDCADALVARSVVRASDLTGTQHRCRYCRYPGAARIQTCTDCCETTLLVSIEPIFLRPGPDRVLSVVAELTGVSALLGFEEFTYLVIFLWLVVGGPGPLSLDRLIARRLARPR